MNKNWRLCGKMLGLAGVSEQRCFAHRPFRCGGDVRCQMLVRILINQTSVGKQTCYLLSRCLTTDYCNGVSQYLLQVQHSCTLSILDYLPHFALGSKLLTNTH